MARPVLGEKKYGFSAAMKDLDIITQRMMDDEALCRLLYHKGDTALAEPALTAEEKIKLIEDHSISTVPVLRVDEKNTVRNFIVLGFDNFMPSGNPEFVDVILSIDILCHVDNWKVYDRKGALHYRPYALAEIIYDLLYDRKLTGIGKPQFAGATSLVLTTNPDYAGITLQFVCTNAANY